MKLLHRLSMIAARFASKEVDRYSMRGLQVTDKEAVATDGAIQCWITHPKWKVEDFPMGRPAVSGMKGDAFPAFLEATKAERLYKFIPKKQTIPALAGILTDGKQFVATDLETDIAFENDNKDCRKWDWDKSIPAENPLAQVVFDAKYLALIAKAVKDFQEYGDGVPVRLTIYPDGKAARFDATINADTGQAMSIILMPYRETESTFPKLPHEEKG